jgi:hypothetical protein
MRIGKFSNITPEDFDEELQPAMSKLAETINPFLETVSSAFDGKIDFDNLNQEIVEFQVEVDSNGVPKTQLGLSSRLFNRVRGYIVIRAQPNNPNAALPTANPLITYSQTESGIRVLGVTGLPPNVLYRITAIAIG